MLTKQKVQYEISFQKKVYNKVDFPFLYYPLLIGIYIYLLTNKTKKKKRTLIVFSYYFMTY